MVSSPSAPFASRVQACLMGGALGNSLGYLVRADDIATIQARFGPAGLLDASQAGEQIQFGADTQLTLYTLDGLIEALEWANDGVAADEAAILWLAYLRWLATQEEQASAAAPLPQPRWIDRQDILHHRRDPDPTVLSALASGEMGTPGRPLNPQARGAAVVARSAPFGLIPHLPATVAATLAGNAAALTHGHASAIQTAAAYGWLIHCLVHGGLDPAGAASSARDHAAATPSADPSVAAALDAALTLAAAGRSGTDGIPAELGNGNTATEALAMGLYTVLATEAAAASPTEHFLSAVRLAVNIDGASEVTGTVAGAILGAFYGEECLPQAWLALAQAAGLIQSMAKNLLEVTGAS
jgi:ADP-ribosylglycohydrolase